MDASYFPYVHQIQPCIHVGGELTVQKVNDDPTCRSRLDVLFAHGRGGIEENDVCAGPGCLQDSLLRHELGAFVMADHVVQADWRILVARLSVGSESHSC